MGYWSVIEPYWTDFPSGDPQLYLKRYAELPPVVRDLITTHWLYSEVCNGGFHQLLTNPTGMMTPEAAAGFEAMGLIDLASIAGRAMRFFGADFPRDQMQRIAALDHYADGQASDDWNPFTALDEGFYSALGSDGPDDAFIRAADEYSRRPI